MTETAVDRERTRPETWIRPRRIMRVTALRRTVAADVQLKCGVGPYQLDLVVREGESPDVLELSGQVRAAGDVGEPVTGLPVALVGGESPGGNGLTQTDGFGEFELTGVKADRLGVRLGGRENGSCVLVWEDVD